MTCGLLFWFHLTYLLSYFTDFDLFSMYIIAVVDTAGRLMTLFSMNCLSVL